MYGMMICLSLITLFQEDIKKIIAYSTSNQSFFIRTLYRFILMIFYAYLHLIGHAFFKKFIIFNSRQSLYIILSNNQDIRNYGDFIFNTINFKFFYHNIYNFSSKHFHLHLRLITKET